MLKVERVVILAAGASSRFWPLSSDRHKSFYRCGLGKSLVQFTIANLLSIKSIGEIFLVVSPGDGPRARDLFGSYKKVIIFIQKEPLGEGDALLSAFEDKKIDAPFFLTTPDKFNAHQILKRLEKIGTNSIAIRKTDKPQLYGIVQLNKQKLIKDIVEKPRVKKSEISYRITSGYLLDSSFINILQKSPQEQYSLELALNKFIKKEKVYGVEVDDLVDITLKYPWHLLGINKILHDAKKFYFLHPKVNIAKSAILSGSIFIDEGAIISDYVKIVGPCFIGKNAFIGEYCLIRDHTFIDDNVVVGCQSEIKNSLIYKDTHLHRNFIGDSIIDENSRIGAGTVFANRRIDRAEVTSFVKGEKVNTGLTHLGSILGKDVKIGINCSLMPGTKIGSGTTIWPHTLVLKDVPDRETLK